MITAEIIRIYLEKHIDFPHIIEIILRSRGSAVNSFVTQYINAGYRTLSEHLRVQLMRLLSHIYRDFSYLQMPPI